MNPVEYPELFAITAVAVGGTKSGAAVKPFDGFEVVELNALKVSPMTASPRRPSTRRILAQIAPGLRRGFTSDLLPLRPPDPEELHDRQRHGGHHEQKEAAEAGAHPEQGEAEPGDVRHHPAHVPGHRDVPALHRV